MANRLYIFLLTVCALLLTSIFVFSKEPKKTMPAPKERNGAIALTAEWLNTKEVIKGLVEAIESDPANNGAKLQLARAYIQESRITGDHAYYDKAALELLNDVVTSEPGNFDALCCKATVLLSQHHFAEGLAVAKQALPVNPDNAFIYGLMCDAYVELGNYPEAVKMCDKMISIRPDIRSYARVSYLREIHGDLPGAIEAAKLAVSSGYPGLEQTEWTRTVLGHLYEITGELDSASIQYKTVLIERPDYAFAVAGLGRIEKAKGNYKDAIKFFEKARTLIIEYSFSDELTELYALNKEPEKAKRSAQEVIAMLSPVSEVDENSSGHGHYADKELAHAYLKVPDTENALKHAMIEFKRRPANMDVCETLAWAMYKNGQYKTANTLINAALRTNSKNPELLCHAGLIKMKAGELRQGNELLKKVLATNSILDADLKKESLSYLPAN